ncbi:MAG TPA: class I SAM-dependent methyltransferase [Pseudonocardiaceae bacterium]|nr:class I SAM-dependent methyltransferase [Pseudonocardiaceae bacterium]
MTGHHAVFDPILAGQPAQLVGDDGRILRVAPQRWLAPAGGEDGWLLDRCAGPTVDLGCGPGRLVAELAGRGVPALGVDCSPLAVAQCQHRGAAVLHRDVFATLPGEGQWHHVLLADGNIGIGGDPARLLLRCAALLRRGGTLLIEAGHPGTGHPGTGHPGAGHSGAGLWRGAARLEMTGGAAGPWFPWAVAELPVLAALAALAGFQVGDRYRGARCFIELRHVSGR